MRDPKEWATVPDNDYNAAGLGYITSQNVQIDPKTKDLVLLMTKRDTPISRGGVDRTHNTGYVRSRGVTDFHYGRYEWVAKHSGVRGKDTGFFPALWLRPTDPKATKGEPDMIEYFGGKPDNALLGSTLHYDNSNGDKLGKRWLPKPGTENDWHRYTMDFLRDRVDFYYDGELKMSSSRENVGAEKWDRAFPPGIPWGVIMNVDCGGGSSSYVGAPTADTEPRIEWRIKSFNYWSVESGAYDAAK